MMNSKIKFAVAGFCALGLSSCTMLDDGTGDNLYYSGYPSSNDNYAFMPNNANVMNYNYKYNDPGQPKQDVVVPDSYHVGDMRTPVSFQDRDKTWVSNQNPQSYTIQLTDGDKAAKVAQVLYKTPKSDRVAQVKYQRGGKEYYRGVYGSYPSAAEAQKALDALPSEIKSGATVKNWGSVQP